MSRHPVTWLRRLGAASQEPRIGAVSADHADRMAAIHAGAFARPWGADEFESFLADRAVRADGLFLGRDRQPSGFALSRVTLDEAEILSVAIARAMRGRGQSRLLLANHLQTLAHAGAERVHLEVEEGNGPALALYHRLGFAQSGREARVLRPPGRDPHIGLVHDQGPVRVPGPPMTLPGVAVRVAILALVFAAAAPVQVLAIRRGWRLAAWIPVRFHRLFLRLFEIRVTVRGTPPSPARPTLVLANHVSWLDISVIAGLVPLSFIAKSEIAGWPLFGTLSRLQRCVFVDRSRKAATQEVNAVVAARLAAGDAIVLFPEGTTGDGIRLLPFRSSLVGAARAALLDPALDAIHLQPLAVVYAGRNGLPLSRSRMPDIAWYGDMELPPHLGAYVRGGPVEVVVVWGEPIPFGAATDRKAATAEAEAAVRDAVRSVRTGDGAILLAAGRS